MYTKFVNLQTIFLCSEILMNMRNVKTTSNLSLRKKQRMLKLEANVNGQLVKKSTKFFLNLEKNDPLKRFVRKLEVN